VAVVPADAAPARTTRDPSKSRVELRHTPGFLVEIDAVAVI
jgi:hypothetical protein